MRLRRSLAADRGCQPVVCRISCISDRLAAQSHVRNGICIQARGLRKSGWIGYSDCFIEIVDPQNAEQAGTFHDAQETFPVLSLLAGFDSGAFNRHDFLDRCQREVEPQSGRSCVDGWQRFRDDLQYRPGNPVVAVRLRDWKTKTPATRTCETKEIQNRKFQQTSIQNSPKDTGENSDENEENQTQTRRKKRTQ